MKREQIFIAAVGIVAAILFCLLIFLGIADATPSITANYDPAVDYYEIELNGVVYESDTIDGFLRADLAELPDGIYMASIRPIGFEGGAADVHFTLFKQSDKNKCYYSMTPEPGYESFFAEPLVMVINIKAGKAVGN